MVNGASSLIGGLILLPGSVLNGLGQPLYGWMLDHLSGKIPLGLFTILVSTLVFSIASSYIRFYGTGW